MLSDRPNFSLENHDEPRVNMPKNRENPWVSLGPCDHDLEFFRKRWIFEMEPVVYRRVTSGWHLRNDQN